jgi:hypothetical protein
MQLMADDRDLVAAEKLARWLDDRGLDPVLGLLLPGVGDVLGTVAGLYTVVVAVRRRMPVVVIARMLANLGVDALIGLVPVLGDVFDFAWKANRRNVALLRDRTERGRPSVGDWALIGGAVLLLVASVVLTGLGVRWLWRVATGG